MTGDEPIEPDWKSPRESLQVLVRERAFLIVFCLSAAITSLALTYVASEKFESTAAVFYRPHQVTATRPAGIESFGAPTPVPPFKMIGRTLQELAASDALLGPIVTEVGLDREGPIEGGWFKRLYRSTKDFVVKRAGEVWMLLKHGRIIEEDPFAKALARLRKSTTVVSEDSYVFYISVRDKHPGRATLTVNLLADRLVNWLRDEERKPGDEKREQLATLLAEKQHELDEHGRAIEELLVGKGIASARVEGEAGIKRWSQMELERVELQGQIRQKRLEIQDLAAKMAIKKRALDPNAPPMTTHIQPKDYQRMASTKAFSEVALVGMEARYAALERETAALRKKIDALPGVENKLDRLTTEFEAAKRDFAILAEQYQDATVRATGRLSEVRVLHPAKDSNAPVAPIKLYHVGLATVLALILAVGLVYLLTFFEVRILLSPESAANPDA